MATVFAHPGTKDVSLSGDFNSQTNEKPENERDGETSQQSGAEIVNDNRGDNRGDHTIEWLYRLAVIAATIAVAYFQIQTSLAIAQLELKIERQRVEDISSRPDNRDIERIESQIRDLREELRRNAHGNSNGK